MTIMYLRRTQSVYPVEFVEGHKIVTVFIRFYTKEHIDLCAYFCVNDPARRDIRSREWVVSKYGGYRATRNSHVVSSNDQQVAADLQTGGSDLRIC